MQLGLSEWMIIAGVVVLVVLVIGAGLFVRRRQQRRRELRSHFGDEYERELDARDSRRSAESELSRRQELFAEQELRSLPDSERDHIEAEIEEAAIRFVDDPRSALAKIDGLVTSVMDARGYDFTGTEEREQLLSVGFPDRISSYRDAHAAAESDREQHSTEDRRRAFLDLRELIGDLMDGREKPPNGAS